MKIVEPQGYFDNYSIKESKDPSEIKKTGVLMTVEGVFQAEDEKNHNGRVYPSETWDVVLSNPDFQTRIKSRNMFGELDHPTDGGSLKRSSHVVTMVERKNVDGRKVLWGKADVLDTPDGHILASLFRAHTKPGVSSRGDGSTEQKEGAEYVKTDYLPEAWDFVIKPSTLNAFPSPITESEKTANSNSILNALENLVEKTTDTKVLLNTYLLLEGYGSNAETLVKKLESKLSVTKPEAKAESKPKTELCSEEHKIPQEEKMDLKNLDKGVETDILHMARDLAESQVKTKEDEFRKEKSMLESQIASMAKRLEHKTKEVDAAEKIIEAFGSKCEALKNRKPLKDVSETKKYRKALYATGKRLEAAKKLVGALMEKAKELSKYPARYNAAEKLVQAFLDKGDRNKVEGFIAETLSGVKDPSKRESVKKIISGCKTITEAKQKLATLGNLLNSTRKPVNEVRRPNRESDRRNPLPGDKKTEITEDVIDRNRPVKSETVIFMDKLREKMEGKKVAK